MAPQVARVIDSSEVIKGLAARTHPPPSRPNAAAPSARRRAVHASCVPRAAYLPCVAIRDSLEPTQQRDQALNRKGAGGAAGGEGYRAGTGEG